MPFVRITVSGKLSKSSETELVIGAKQLMVDVLRKVPELTAVLLEYVPDCRWRVGSGEPGKAAHLEANISAGSVSRNEKETFVREANSLLVSKVGSLEEATYTIIREIPTTDWGYNGETLASRRGE